MQETLTLLATCKHAPASAASPHGDSHIFLYEISNNFQRIRTVAYQCTLSPRAGIGKRKRGRFKKCD